MDNPTVIADDQIKDCQEEDNEKSAPQAKPGREGYVKDVPKDDKAGEKPCLKVLLTSESSPEPKTVSKVVLDGNVKTVTILKKEGKDPKAPFEPVLEKVEVGEDGVVELPTPSEMAEVKVILEKPKDDKDKKFKTTLKVHACGNFSREYTHSIDCRPHAPHSTLP